MSKISLKDLVKATCHIGHVKSRWYPGMAPYIWGAKNNIHLIDVSKTAYQIEKAAAFLQSVASENKSILWVGTKKAAQDIVKSNAINLKSPYVTHRWIGGTLTNFPQVKKSVTKLLHFEDVASKADDYLYTKKEINKFQKLADRLQNNVGGIRKLAWPIGAVVIVDVKKEQAALREAVNARIPVVAIVDTNSNPAGVDYVIPANDDAPRSIAFIIDHLAASVVEGQKAAEKEKAAKVKVVQKPVKEVKTQVAEPKKNVKQESPAGKKPAVAKPVVKKPVAAKSVEKPVVAKPAEKKVESKKAVEKEVAPVAKKSEEKIAKPKKAVTSTKSTTEKATESKPIKTEK